MDLAQADYNAADIAYGYSEAQRNYQAAIAQMNMVEGAEYSSDTAYDEAKKKRRMTWMRQSWHWQQPKRI